MLQHNIFFNKIINFLLNFFIKSTDIFYNFSFSDFKSIRNNKFKKLVYLLPYYSKINLLFLRHKCLKNGLPDPLLKVKFGNITLPNVIFLCKDQNILNQYCKIQKKSQKIDIIILPILIMIGRNSNRILYNKTTNFKNILSFFFLRKNIFIYFSKLISLRNIFIKYKNKNIKNINLILFRTSKIYFLRQLFYSCGPSKIKKKQLFLRILNSCSIRKIIKQNKKISYKKQKNNVFKILKEMSANFSYSFVIFANFIIKYIWKKLYTGINIKGDNKIKKILQKGGYNNIVYLPCHRSHMDYLLVSYVIYHLGIVPPHIVAGINLNFWPIGLIFRKLGAFFIRRTFSKNKLYVAIFQEYFKYLFQKRYSIEFFIEGGRSRTGKLLNPKTGILSIIIQLLIKEKDKNIFFIPIYIGYEHIMEENTYIKELKGANKQKENVFYMIKSFFKLKNLGQVYVNFGEPINLAKYVKNKILKWKVKNYSNDYTRPSWFHAIVNSIAQYIMIKINNACVINSINLCATILLSSEKKIFTYEEFIKQLNFYIKFIKRVPYSKECIIPKFNTAESLFKDALKMNKFKLTRINNSKVIYLSEKQIMLMNYYKNNICHIFIVLSLIVNIVYINKKISLQSVLKQTILIYPLMKSYFFLYWRKKELPNIIKKTIKELIRQNIFILFHKNLTYDVKNKKTIIFLSSIIQNILKKYTIIFFLIDKNPEIYKNILGMKVIDIYKKLVISKNKIIINNFNKNTFYSLINILKKENYIIEYNNFLKIKNKNIYLLISCLLLDQKFISNMKNYFCNIDN